MNIEWVNRQTSHPLVIKSNTRQICLSLIEVNESQRNRFWKGIRSDDNYYYPKGAGHCQVRCLRRPLPMLVGIVRDVTILCRHSYFRYFRWRCSYGKPWNRATEVPASTQKVSQNCATLYNNKKKKTPRATATTKTGQWLADCAKRRRQLHT